LISASTPWKECKSVTLEESRACELLLSRSSGKEETKSQKWMRSKMASGCGNLRRALMMKKCDGKIAENHHDLRSRTPVGSVLFISFFALRLVTLQIGIMVKVIPPSEIRKYLHPQGSLVESNTNLCALSLPED
jgi:hypothetical protein